jgi:hypothetical protein
MQGYTGKVGTLTPLYGDDGLPKYQSGLLWYRIPLFDYRADRNRPFAYESKGGTQYMADNHFETDGGSIPPCTRVIPFAHLDPLNFPRAYVLHDSAFQYGGLYIRYPGEVSFKFRLVTREFANTEMRDWLYFDGANAYTRSVICAGINAAFWTRWDAAKKAKQRQYRAKAKIDVYDKDGFLSEINNPLAHR